MGGGRYTEQKLRENMVGEAKINKVSFFEKDIERQREDLMEDGSREKSNKGKIGWKRKYQTERERVERMAEDRALRHT